MAGHIAASLAWRPSGAELLRESSKTIGLIGLGAWGTNLFHHLTNLGAAVVCYPGTTEASRERLRALSGGRIASSVEELLFDPTIDAVAIATPPETHATLAEQALTAGRHTFVEKPLCLDLVDLERLLVMARENNRVLFTGYTVAFHPVVAELARLSGLGQLQSIWSYRAKTGSFTSDVVSTLLVHDLAVADRLADGLMDWEIRSVSGPDRNPDVVDLTIETTSGGSGQLRVDRVAPLARRELGVWIDDRVFRWDGGRELLEFADGEFLIAYSSPRSALEIELQHFLDALARGGPDPAAMMREQRLAELAINVRHAVLT